MKLTFTSRKDLVEDQTYPATVENIICKDGMYGKYVEFVFRLQGMDILLTARCPLNASMGSRLARWTAAILGMELEEDVTVDIDELIDRSARVKLKKNRKQGREYVDVDDVIPPSDSESLQASASSTEAGSDDVPF